MDKHACRRFLAINGIDVPSSLSLLRQQWLAGDQEEILGTIERHIGFPCIVKPTREGCSTAVKKVVAGTGLPAAMDEAFRWDNTLLVEEFIAGTEVTCGVIEDGRPMALIPSETIPTDDVLSLEDKFLYGQGENKTPARLPEEVLKRIQEVALETFRLLGLVGYARIDMFVRTDGRIVVLEVNSLPGMTPSTVLFHQAAAADITQAGLIDRIIQRAMKAHAAKKGAL
jgi:D-alanine-D-alanine ligase